MTVKQLRGRVFTHPVSGVAVLASAANDLPSRTLAALKVMPPDAVATHFTAAQLRGWWLPRLTNEPVIVCTHGDAPHLDHRGVYVRRCAIAPHHRTSINGIAIASAEWTILELAESLSLLDLVVAIDAALHLGHTTEARIRASMVAGRRGVRTLRKALLLCDGRSESPGETMLRLVHTLSGIAVDPQVEFRERDGTPLIALDLVVRGTRYAPEYDGAPHRDSPTHRRDLRRERTLHSIGIQRAGFTLLEIREHPQEIIRHAAEALGRPGAFSAVDARIEIDRSSVTFAGAAQLERRMRRFLRSKPPRTRG